MKKRMLSVLLALLMALAAAPGLGAGAAESFLWPAPGCGVLSKITRGYSSASPSICIGTSGNVLATKSGTVIQVYSGCRNSGGGASSGRSCTNTGCTASQKQTYGSKKFCNYGFGNGLVLRHDDGTYSTYAHMASVGVAKNSHVSQGQVLGTIGASGYATGTHLEFAAHNTMTQSGNYWRPGSSINTQTLSYISSVPKTFSITLDPNGGQCGVTSLAGEEGGAYSGLPTPTREGYAFTAWQTGGGETARNGSRFLTDGAHTLYARWSPNTYTVSFDLNGGASPGASPKPVEFNSAYGAFPAVTREGYTFAGWYTAAEGGSLVTEETVLTTPANHTLYARWTQAGSQTYRVSFHCQGGAAQVPGLGERESFVREMSFGEAFQELLEPERAGYRFLGWYTEPEGGERIYANTLFDQRQDAAYYAHWERTASSYTVTFNSSGGTVSPISKTVTNGQPYGALPVPVRSGYVFKGWYTGILGSGSLVTAETTVDLAQDQTLIAFWEQAAKKPDFDSLRYQFANSRAAMGYAKGYKIPLDRYQYIFGDTSLAKTLYSASGAWGGSCFGLSTTSAMFFQEDSGVSVDAFRSGADYARELGVNDYNAGWGLTLRDFAEAMQVAWSSSGISAAYSENYGDLSALAKAAQDFQDTGRDAPVVCIYGLVDGKRSGHAVVAYDLQTISSTEDRLIVYDCNFPASQRYITLSRSGGRYTGWYYKLNGAYDWGTGYGNAQITFITYSAYLNAWNQRAGAQKVNLLNVNSAYAEIIDSGGQTAAVIEDGVLRTSRDDIYPLTGMGVTLDGDTEDMSGCSVWLPTGEFTVINKDGSVEDFQAVMTNVDMSASVATSAQEVTFLVEDESAISFVSIPQSASYDIQLSSTLEEGYQDVRLTGSAAGEGVALAQVNGTLYGRGAEDAVSLTVDGQAGLVSTLVGGWNDLDDVLNQKLPFTDVPEKAYYYEPVRWAVERGITSGTSATTFSPGRSCTRGQIVTFLWSAAGRPEPRSAENPFVDVKAGDYFYKAALWAVENKITSGTSASTFSPGRPCTRGQAMTFLWSAAGRPDGTAGSFFSDIRPGSYCEKAVNWAVKNGISSGTGAGAFSPDKPCTRAEIMTFLYRAKEVMPLLEDV